MKRLFPLLGLALAACQPSASAPPVISSVPGATEACTTLDPGKIDIAAKAYGAAIDAIGLLIDAHVLIPGTPKAVAVAAANDRVLAALTAADNARQACEAVTYNQALASARAAIADVHTALHRSN